MQQQRDRKFGRQISNIVQGFPVGKQQHTNATFKLSVNKLKKQNKDASNFKTQQLIKPHKIHNSQPIQDHSEDCLKFMLQRQNKNTPIYNYMTWQVDITEFKRAVLIDYLIDIHSKFKMFPETLFLVVSIIDRYLIKKLINEAKLQLLGISAFYIAAKYQETYKVPKLHELVSLSNNTYTKLEILQMESCIINTLDFNLVTDSPYSFFSQFSQLAQMQKKQHYFAQYILEMSLLYLRFQQFTPSILAAASIFLVNKIRKINQCWSQKMFQQTGHSQEQLKPLAKELYYILQNTKNNPNMNSLIQKFSIPQYYRVSCTKIVKKVAHKAIEPINIVGQSSL